MVSGTFNGIAKVFGRAVPVAAGGTGVYITDQTMAQHDWVMTAQLIPVYYKASNCSPSGPIYVEAANFSYVNQLITVLDNGFAWEFWKINLSGQFKAPNSYASIMDSNGNCINANGTVFGPELSFLSSPAYFDISTTLPWSIVLQ